MGNSVLRKHVRRILHELFVNNSWVYNYGPNKFPNFDGEDITPSDLDSEFDAEFDFLHNELGESENNVGLNSKQKKLPKLSKG